MSLSSALLTFNRLCRGRYAPIQQVNGLAYSSLLGDSGHRDTLQCQQPYSAILRKLHNSVGLSAAVNSGTPTASAVNLSQENLKLAADVVQQIQVEKLRLELEDEAERSLHIPYSSFVRRALDHGAATTEKGAAELCEAMQRSGLLLRHHDVVYLRMEEITEMIAKVLPGGVEDANKKLAKIEEELTEMDTMHKEAMKSANRVTNTLLTFGCIVLFTQFVAFIYLTWYELSWDVMEPIAYIISLFYSLLAYIYFLVTRGAVFDLLPFQKFWTTRILKRKIQTIRLDEERYQYLQRLRDRYKKHLAHRAIRSA